MGMVKLLAEMHGLVNGDSNYEYYINKKKVTTAVQLTKSSLKAYFEALNIYVVIANQNYRRQSNIKVNQYLEKKKDFLNGLSCSLLLAYDKEKDESFWNSSVKLKEIDSLF